MKHVNTTSSTDESVQDMLAELFKEAGMLATRHLSLSLSCF